MGTFSFKRIYKGSTEFGVYQRNLSEANIDKAKCFTNILLIKDEALPGNVNDVKHLTGPTESTQMTIKKSKIGKKGCNSIQSSNIDKKHCPKFQYVLSKNVDATADSSFKLELPTDHLEGDRWALLLQTITVNGSEDAGAMWSMMELEKGSGDQEASAKPHELVSSIGASGKNQFSKSITGFNIVKVTNKLHKVSLRVLTEKEYIINDFDQDKSEISISSIFLPPNSIVKQEVLTDFNIEKNPEGYTWHTFSVEPDVHKAREMIFMYNIVFHLKEKHRVTKMKEINEETFKAPFQAWVEIKGKPVMRSITKSGGDQIVSIQIMFPHLEEASEQKFDVQFK